MKIPPKTSTATLLALLGAAVTCAAMFAIAALQYARPADWTNTFGANQAAVDLYRDALFAPPRLSIPQFSTAFKVLLALGWGGYALALVAGFRSRLPRFRVILSLVGGSALLVALFCPPSLSLDSSLYLAYARMQLAHGINPYAHTLEQLQAVREPLALNLGPSGYPPIWTLVSMGLWFCVGTASAFWQLCGVKLFAAVALVAAALAGRAIAERFEPGRGDLALLAIGINPLFVLEGPGNGHNDLLMLALLLLGVLLCLRDRYLAGILLLGLSVGIKYITLPIVPWLLIERLRGKSWRERVGITVVTAVLALGPLVLGFALFWRGPDTLTGLLHHATWGTHARAGGGGEGGGAAHSIVARLGPTLVIYLALTIWLWRRREPGLPLTAWVPLAVCIVFSSGVSFPWYFIWPFIVSLTRWNRIHIGLSAACVVMAACLTAIYTMPFPR